MERKQNKFMNDILGDTLPYMSKLSPNFTTTQDKLNPPDKNPRKYKFIRISMRLEKDGK